MQLPSVQGVESCLLVGRLVQADTCCIVDGMVLEHKARGTPPAFAIVACGSGVAEGMPFACDGSML